MYRCQLHKQLGGIFLPHIIIFTSDCKELEAFHDNLVWPNKSNFCCKEMKMADPCTIRMQGHSCWIPGSSHPRNPKAGLEDIGCSLLIFTSLPLLLLRHPDQVLLPHLVAMNSTSEWQIMWRLFFVCSESPNQFHLSFLRKGGDKILHSTRLHFINCYCQGS